jgi:hypothetical protein
MTLTESQLRKKEYNKKYREKKRMEFEKLKNASDELKNDETHQDELKPTENAPGNFFLNKMKTKAMMQVLDMTMSLGIPLMFKIFVDVGSHVFVKQHEPLRVELPKKQLEELSKDFKKEPQQFALSSIPNF